MTTNHTDLIKEKLSILDVVGSYVSLEKAGKTWKGKSPFTNEKTPSFFVSPDKGFFYCFSSGKGGDMFTFIQEIERVDFRSALSLLAEKAGVSLEQQGDTDKTKRLFSLIDDAAKYYEVHLRKDTKVVEYLLNRGLTKQTIIDFRIGFALDSWSDMYDFLKRKKYSDEEIEDAGLTIKKEKGGYYDRFRSRIMFPLFDAQSRIVGFSGRIFTENPDEKGAKYVNSPQTVLYDKSKILYGYHRAKGDISKEDFCIITEGQFDVIMAQQIGSVNTVAVSGTGLTDDHISLVKRFTNNLYLAFDSDSAGIKATKRSVLKAYEHGMKVKVIALPEGKDPADIIKATPPLWHVLIKDAKDYIDFRLDVYVTSNPNSDFDHKYAFVTTEIFEFVFLLESQVVQDMILQKLALFVGVQAEAMRKDFSSFTPQETLVFQEIKTPETFEKKDNLDIEDMIGSYQLLLNSYATEFVEDKSNIDEMILLGYERNINDIINEFDTTKLEMLSFKMETQYAHEKYDRVYDHLYQTLKKQCIKILNKESEEISRHIRSKEQEKDQEALFMLIKKSQEIRRKIDHLISNE